MPRRNKRRKPVMLCSCGKRIPISYSTAHIDRCLRARRQHNVSRGNRYPKGD